MSIEANYFMIKNRRILGIDPGTNLMGAGIIEADGQKIEVLHFDVIKIKNEGDAMLKLKKIFEVTVALIEKYLPDEMAVEAPFYGNNIQSMLKLGRAQGVVMAAAMFKNISIAEYAPKKVKQSITGKGAASKEQVANMLKMQFGIEISEKTFDATDALAVALCHHYQNLGIVKKTAPNSRKKGGAWEQFLRNNPDKLL